MIHICNLVLGCVFIRDFISLGRRAFRREGGAGVDEGKGEKSLLTFLLRPPSP